MAVAEDVFGGVRDAPTSRGMARRVVFGNPMKLPSKKTLGKYNHNGSTHLFLLTSCRIPVREYRRRLAKAAKF